MRSELFGGHDPRLADGSVPGRGVGDAVGDVSGGEDLGLLEAGSIISLRTSGLLCEPSSVGQTASLSIPRLSLDDARCLSDTVWVPETLSPHAN
jgi:hypothetical protein